MRGEKYRLGDTWRGAINKSRPAHASRSLDPQPSKVVHYFLSQRSNGVIVFHGSPDVPNGLDYLTGCARQIFLSDWTLSNLTAFARNIRRLILLRSISRNSFECSQNFVVRFRNSRGERFHAAGIFAVISNRVFRKLKQKNSTIKTVRQCRENRRVPREIFHERITSESPRRVQDIVYRRARSREIRARFPTDLAVSLALAHIGAPPSLPSSSLQRIRARS